MFNFNVRWTGAEDLNAHIRRVTGGLSDLTPVIARQAALLPRGKNEPKFEYWDSQFLRVFIVGVLAQ